MTAEEAKLQATLDKTLNDLYRTRAELGDARRAADRNANLAGECMADLTQIRGLVTDGSGWANFNAIEKTRADLLAILNREHTG